MSDSDVKRRYTAEIQAERSGGAGGAAGTDRLILRAIERLEAHLARTGLGGGNLAAPVNGHSLNGHAAATDKAATSEAARELDEIRRQISEMAATIEQAKREIAAIRHPLASEDPMLDASSHLDAIVSATERATNEILEATEQVEDAVKRMVAQDAENDELLSLSDEVGGHLIRIMEACGFQDITGQRITKVVKTLRLVEDKISAIIGIWGPQGFETIPVTDVPAPENQDEALLSGPQLEGQGISQSDIDALFD